MGPVDSADPLRAVISENIDATTFTFNYPQEGNALLYGDGYSICGRRIIYLEDKNNPAAKIAASGYPSDLAPYVNLTSFDTDVDFTKRYYTVNFKSISEKDYGLHEFYFK